MNWLIKESWPIMWLLMKKLQYFECCEFSIKKHMWGCKGMKHNISNTSFGIHNHTIGSNET
jgi:hypothetical protein